MRLLAAVLFAALLSCAVAKPIKPECEALLAQNLTLANLDTGIYFYDDFSGWMSFDATFEYCSNRGLEMVTANSLLEIQNLWNMTKGTIWTSGQWVYDSAKPPGDFRWVGGAVIPLNSELWAPGEPDTYLEGRHCCVQCNSGRLHDAKCSDWYAPVCEIPTTCYK
ncbi:C-type lectin domain family 4 member G-like [Neocloeon triangulifer]|uniref:C-type lectin domain family 4 member G-like n=1 Tax=Neocloeon triangulifer TaxID=2078957 RepID=UPI00286F086E|nr:C-type lectin domain family 4 member G-like [Neocloeon triangulifer]